MAVAVIISIALGAVPLVWKNKALNNRIVSLKDTVTVLPKSVSPYCLLRWPCHGRYES